jgi:hypothetical protein
VKRMEKLQRRAARKGEAIILSYFNITVLG